MIDWLIDWLIDWMIDWLNEWINEWNNFVQMFYPVFSVNFLELILLLKQAKNIDYVTASHTYMADYVGKTQYYVDKKLTWLWIEQFVFLSRTIYSHDVSLHPGVSIYAWQLG